MSIEGGELVIEIVECDRSAALEDLPPFNTDSTDVSICEAATTQQTPDFDPMLG